MNVLVTGSRGFIGKNLIAWLVREADVRVLEFDQEHTLSELAERLAEADLVYHLAGVNRPQSVEEFHTGNVELTARVCELLLHNGRATPIVFSSSIQAELDNPYGASKRQAEAVLADYAQRSSAVVAIFRLSNVFGKWCRPHYNSVVATFCYQIAHDLPITISDPSREVLLVHVDDVVQAFWEVGRAVQGQKPESQWTGKYHASLAGVHSIQIAPSSLSYYEARPIYTVTLGRLAELIRSFRESRQSLLVPDFSDPFVYKLYGTYLSYLEPSDLAYDLTQRTDARGTLAEFVKSPAFGQIFVSRTRPGVTRGNHFHHTKAEKFLVLEGEAVIRLRAIRSQKSEVKGQKSEGRGQRAEVRGQRSEVRGQGAEGDGQGVEVIEYRVSGQDFRVVDIPPGYTHSIENVGEGELVTLFWASEVFDAERSDTIYEEV